MHLKVNRCQYQNRFGYLEEQLARSITGKKIVPVIEN